MKQTRELGYSWAVVLAPHQGGRQVYVLGVSAGGTPAIRFALDDPERTAQALFFSAPPPSGIKSHKTAGRMGSASVVNRNYLI